MHAEAAAVLIKCLINDDDSGFIDAARYGQIVEGGQGTVDSGQWTVDGRQLPMSFAYLSAAGLTDEIADQTSAKSVQLTIDSWNKNGNRGIRMGNKLQCANLMDQLRLSRNKYKD